MSHCAGCDPVKRAEEERYGGYPCTGLALPPDVDRVVEAARAVIDKPMPGYIRVDKLDDLRDALAALEKQQTITNRE